MKTIKGQIIAGTGIDAHGDNITKRELRVLFDQIPEELIVNQHHNLSKPPVGRMYNKQFVETSDGEFVIKVDVDVFNEGSLKEMKGFSISYTDPENRLTLNRSRKGDIEILFNPLVFNREDMIYLIKTSNESIQIDAIELKQKALEHIAILILKFAAVSFVTGFLGKAGVDAYKALKAKIIELAEKRKAKKESRIILQLVFTGKIAGRSVYVIIELLPEDLNIVKQYKLSIESALQYTVTTIGHNEIQRVALRVQRKEPYWTLVYFVDMEGNVVRLNMR